MNKEMIGNFIENMATDAMKDNFLALNNKEKHKEFCDLLDKERQLQNNWNELKKYAKEHLYFYSGYQGEDLEEDLSIKDLLDKMQELEGNNE